MAILIVSVGILLYLIEPDLNFEHNLTSFRNDVRQNIYDTLVEIAREDEVACRAVGDGGEEPAQWRRFLWLVKNASDDELISAFRNSKNSAIKAYTFKILNGRKHPETLSLLKPILLDSTSFVYEICGCLGETYHLRNYLTKVYLQGPLFTEADLATFEGHIPNQWLKYRPYPVWQID